MSRLTRFLLGLLLVQGGIVAALFWPGESGEDTTVRQPLVPFDATAVDTIRIGDAADNEVELRRSGQRWVLPELDGLPARDERVATLLSALTGVEALWPVADSAAARQRFQVADYLYNRRLEFSAGGQVLATVYLGTSPGFRKVHARNAQQKEIYSIHYNNHDAPATRSAWLDPDLLAVRSPVAIVADAYSLRFDGAQWITGSGAVPDEQALQTLLDALRNLQIEGVAPDDVQRDLADSEADLVLKITGLGGETVFELFQLGGEHYIRSSAHPFFFSLSGYDYAQLTGVDLARITGE